MHEDVQGKLDQRQKVDLVGERGNVVQSVRKEGFAAQEASVDAKAGAPAAAPLVSLH